jgi:Flp pilus assembly protein TadG
MNTLRITSKKQSGQVLVFVAIILIAFIALAALLTDGGIKMLTRRQAQAAADAGALAGARVLCKNSTNAQAKIIAETYASQAIGDSANTSASASSPLSPGNLVTVNVSVSHAQVFSSSPLVSSATATAGCYVPPSLNQIFPIAWVCYPASSSSDYKDCNVRELYYNSEMLPLLSKSGTVSIHDPSNPGNFITVNANTFPGTIISKFIYILVDGKGATGFDTNSECKSDGGSLNCDINGDGVNEILGGGNYAWLCLNGDSKCSANDLKGWVKATGGYSGYISVGAPYYSNNATRTAVLNQMGALRFTLLPVLNPGGGSSWTVTSFSTFYVTCVATKTSDCPGSSALAQANPKMKSNDFGSAIEGYFVSDYPYDLNDPSVGKNVGVNWVSLIP